MIHDSEHTTQPSFNSRLSAVFQGCVSPILSSHGFRKVKHGYEKKMEGLVWLLEIQRSRWNDAVEAQFTINCGIFVPGVVSRYVNQPERTRIDSTGCCIHARI